MKIVAINGSPRKNGNTAQVLEVVRREVEAAGVEFQVFQPGAKVHPCMACYHCLNTGSLRCVQTDDMVNDIIAACIEADGILLAAPVYHGGISGNMKCVLDRLMLAAGCGVNQLHHKVGGALCTLRRSGGSHRGSLVATRSLPACGGSSHGRSLVATSGSFAAGCGCLGRRSGLGLRLRGHQSLGLRERGLRLSLLDRHLLGAEISGNDDRAVVFAVLESFVQLFLAAHLRPGDGRLLAALRSRRGRDVLDQGVAHVHIALRRLHALVERQNRERQPLHLHVRHRVEHDGHDACRHDADEQRHYVLRFPEFLEHREPPSECVAGA